MALSEKSHMDDYMQHPGKVIKQNNKYYFQTVLNNASFWKEYKFYNANNQELATTVVNDNKKADTRTINVAVEPGYKSLTTKVHIVVPQINYNHRYTTHLEFEKAIPTLADAAKPTMLNRFNQNQLNLILTSKLNQFNLKLKKLNLL